MMRTSVPGICKPAGFTLIEMLVVLLIMGMLAGVAVAIVQPDERARLRGESERLAQLLALAAEEARLGGNPIAWTADGSGYRFWRMADEPGFPAPASAAWTEIRDNDLLRARTLPRGMKISRLLVESTPVQGGMRLAFAPGLAPLAFTVELSLGDTHGAVAASPMGEMKVLPLEGDSNAAPASR
jgi:general secretion pathway protein H